MNGIYWLSSYPKSGNTWLRCLLSNYISDSKKPINVNELTLAWAFATPHFESALGIHRQDLTIKQINRIRPLFYEKVAKILNEPTFSKIHDVFELNDDGNPIFPRSSTQGIIYILRNPLDVAVSYSNHMGISIDDTISYMNDVELHLRNTFVKFSALPQKLSSWSAHVTSWTNLPDYRTITVRYEDLLTNTADVFSRILQFSELDLDSTKLEKAVKFSNIKALKKQEKANGFRERLAHTDSFFRKGVAGDWKSRLTEKQVNRLITDHGEVMQRFGYLDTNGNPV